MSNQSDDGVGWEGESISSSQSLILDLPPSCIEFCPAHPAYFLVGTYNLQKEEHQQTEDNDDDDDAVMKSKAKQLQSRNGSIIVFQLKEDGKVYPIQTLAQPSAVFDLHFQPKGQAGASPGICATVSSTGTISLFKLTPTTNSPEILTQLSILRIPNLDDDTTLFTFFAWHPAIAGLMAITTAAGSVVLVRIHDDYQGLDVLEDGEGVLEHDGLEAWCVAFSQPQQQQPTFEQSSPSLPGPSAFTIFSGGDDSKLRYTLYDASSSPSTGHENDDVDGSIIRTPYPAASLGNHEAGVTFILPLPIPQNDDGSYLIATGSYDESLRIWRITPLDRTYGQRKAKLLAEKNLGGGVWRLNILNVANSTDGWKILVLASCMHAGSRIVRIRGDEDDVEMEVLARFEEHKSMNYGSDWFRGGGAGIAGKGGKLIVSTSFYDRMLCVWTVKDGAESSSAS